MAQLEWNSTSYYESGIDRGVIYKNDGTSFSWSGLIKIDELYENKETMLYFEGSKYLDRKQNVSGGFAVEASNLPLEFDSLLGNIHVVPGFILTEQEPLLFNMSYRTKIKNDNGYKIHIIYNACIFDIPQKTMTLGDNNISTVNVAINTYPINLERLNLKPTSHITFDTTKMTPQAVLYLESILYGSKDPAKAPSIFELSALFNELEFLKINVSDSGVFSLTNLGEDLVKTMVDGITIRTTTSRLTKTSIFGIYRMES